MAFNRPRAFSSTECSARSCTYDDNVLMTYCGLRVVQKRTFLELEMFEEKNGARVACDDCEVVDLSTDDEVGLWSAESDDDHSLSDVDAAMPDVDCGPALTISSSSQTSRRFSHLTDVPLSRVHVALQLPNTQSHSKTTSTDCQAAVAHRQVHIERTTLLLKNVPKNCNTRILCELLDACGLKGCYDFVYVPSNLQKRIAFGFAFVNLVSNHGAQCAMKWLVSGAAGEWTNLEILWSDPHQGLDAQIERYRNSPLLHEDVPDECKPMLFNRVGARLPFPSATKFIKASRLPKLL